MPCEIDQGADPEDPDEYRAQDIFWVPSEARPGLPAYLELFPNRLVASEVGEIPEGWAVKSYGDLLSDVIDGDWGKEAPDEKHTRLPRSKHSRDCFVPLFTEASLRESLTLMELRDTLLPRDISGELRLKDAGQILGRAV